MNNLLLLCMMSMIISHIQQSNLFTKAYKFSPMEYHDQEYRPFSKFRPEGDLYKNVYFDRVVAIFLVGDNPKGSRPDLVTIAPGILFNNNRVLTSFNPFRKLSKQTETLERTRVVALTGRHFQYLFNNENSSYATSERKISCARQVMPIKEEDLTEDQWFGTKRLHSPVHDLMVLRVDSPFTIVDITIRKIDLTAWPQHKQEYFLKTGPSLSKLAQPGDYLGPEVQFGSIGFVNDYHIWASAVLIVKIYEAEDNAIVNCERWFPRDWGYFICIKNIDKFEGVGSGAVLVYKEKVFGIGSFFLEKANESILVFTDVRKYAKLINITCTAYDGGA